MNIDVVQEAFHRSHRGQITFPEQAKMLADAGIEAYHVDLARSEWRYYTPSGESHVEISSEQHAPAADPSVDLPPMVPAGMLDDRLADG